MEGVGREGKRRWDCSHLPSGKPCNLAQLGTLGLSWSSCWALLGWLSTSRAPQEACRMPGVGGCIWPSTWLKRPRSPSQRRWWAKLTLYCCVCCTVVLSLEQLFSQSVFSLSYAVRLPYIKPDTWQYLCTNVLSRADSGLRVSYDASTSCKYTSSFFSLMTAGLSVGLRVELTLHRTCASNTSRVSWTHYWTRALFWGFVVLVFSSFPFYCCFCKSSLSWLSTSIFFLFGFF